MPITLTPDAPLNQVRLLIGDTSGEYIDDAVITYLLSTNDNDVGKVSLAALDYIIAELCKLCDQTTDEVAVKYSQVLANYRKLKADLIAGSFGEDGALFIIGGTSKAKNEAFYNNSDTVKSPVRSGDALGSTSTERSISSPFYLRDY